MTVMDKKARSIDGIILRPNNANRQRVLDSEKDNVRITLDNVSKGNIERVEPILRQAPLVKKPLQKEKPAVTSRLDDPALLHDDIGNSLMALNEIADNSYQDARAMKKLKRQSKRSKTPKNPKKPKKILKRVLLILLAIVLLGGGFLAWRLITASDNIFEGNIVDIFNNEKLLEDENGRSNIVIFGTAPAEYDGPLLADTVIVLSVNQTNKTAYTVSLPRDLYVAHDCPYPYIGTSAGKLNETYRCVYDEDIDNEREASDAFREQAGKVLGLDVQYYAHLSWQGVEQIVDTVGGIDITIESDDPRGIYDYNTGVKYANGEVAHLDGVAAMALARSRGAGGGYGFNSFGGSNYFREHTQQKIIQALQAKALSTGTLANPVTALNILNALGENVRTNFKTSEINALVKLARETDTNNIQGIPLRDSANGVSLTVSDMINGASVEIPTAGTFDYSEIHKYIAKMMSDDPIIREAALVDVLNGSGVIGLAQEKADELSSLDYKISSVANAPDGKYDTFAVYLLNSAKSGTAKALAKKYDIQVQTELPVGVVSDADIVIIFGEPKEISGQ